MRFVIILSICLASIMSSAQQDSLTVYKKRILEYTEVDILSSYYNQDGDNASVTGGIGNQDLVDITPTIIVNLPLNADDVLSLDFGISTYTSASSSNLDPLDETYYGSPWIASSGASSGDTWGGLYVTYSSSSDDRSSIWSINASSSIESDYASVGFGGSFTKHFNKNNAEISFKTNVYLDTWKPRYPSELDSYVSSNGDLNQGFFIYLNIYDQNGSFSDDWMPVSGFQLINNKSRNSYALTINYIQILNKRTQILLILDLAMQNGWLANPMHRIYFQDIPNYYVGNPSSIPIYTSQNNSDVFQLADDIERLPNIRFKVPIGIRLNYYINEVISLRTYYRYYFDDWGINSHTASLEVPIKIARKLTLYPSYRFYNQTAADYFAPYEENLSTSEYYTSDYDLSKFSANQYGFGISYTDIFSKFHIGKFGLKTIDFKYHNYSRNNGLNANIFAFAFKFIMD